MKLYWFAYQEWDRMPKWRAFMSYDPAMVEQVARNVLAEIRGRGKGWALQYATSDTPALRAL
jgi:hypothetical protein